MELPGPRAVLGLPGRAVHEVVNVGILARTGLLTPVLRPDRAAGIALAAARWRASPATPVLVGAQRHPDRPALADDLGTLTYRELDEQSNAIAHGLAGLGHTDHDRVAILCRDHRFLVLAELAAAKLGADVLLLNTSFAAPQLAETCAREGATVLVHDEELAPLVAQADVRTRLLGWTDSSAHDGPALAELARACSTKRPPAPRRAARIVLLTSGTTGTPKGAARGGEDVRTLDPAAGILGRLPVRAGQRVHVAAPLFHGWGFGTATLTLAFGGTLVLRRRFDPEGCLAALAGERCEVLSAVPVMLERILALPAEVRDRHDLSALKGVIVSGSALPAGLATRWMDVFGDHVHNCYGSTEVAICTVAGPRDLRKDPRTAGHPVRGTTVRLYDDAGLPTPPGAPGRVFVGNAVLFGGYTGGESKEVIDGLMATGDVGRFDAAGRLRIEGRDDEMLVSGGENVFPQEVEDVLAAHPDVVEAAARAVPDEQFGQRLRAWVVLRDGAGLDEAALQAHVRERLARYKVPREVVAVDELPRTPTGKVRKKDLV